MLPELTRREALAVIAEMERRAKARSISLIDDNFPHQAAFLRDPSRRKGLYCTRRAGKTNGLGRFVLDPLLTTKNRNSLYATLTKDSCRSLFWNTALNDILEELDEHKIKVVPNEGRMELYLPDTNSYLYCTGMDATPKEMKKILGNKYVRVAIDECGSFKQDLSKIVEEALWPTLIDWLGSMALGGTPEALTSGIFYEITRQDGKPRRPGWSVHEWTGEDNPYVRENWRKDIAELIALNPRVVETPAFRRAYLKQWVIDDADHVYKFNRDRNWIPFLEETRPISYGIGLDLGFNDESAWSILGVPAGRRCSYVVHAEKHKELDFHQVAEKTLELMRAFRTSLVVVDGANKQGIETMRRYSKIPFVIAEKKGKLTYIELYNSALIQGEQKLVGENTDQLASEYSDLIWDRKFDAVGESVKLIKTEHPSCPNHLADATLYIWRQMIGYQYIIPDQKKMTEEEKVEAEEEREAMLVQRRKRRRRDELDDFEEEFEKHYGI